MRACRGISDEPVKAKSVPKSMLAAKAFGSTSSWDTVKHWVRVLCTELSERMEEDSALHQRRPKNLVVQFRHADKGGRFGAGQERSRCAPSRVGRCEPAAAGKVLVLRCNKDSHHIMASCAFDDAERYWPGSLLQPLCAAPLSFTLQTSHQLRSWFLLRWGS
jgi:impB/mucB/samB family C-terminal domain